MQAIKCELCGSNQLIKENGYYQCEHCGTKYTLEEAKKLIVSGTIEVVDGENKKAKLKKDINTYIQINNFVKAIKLMTEYTDIFPEDPDGYKMKLDFICDHGCCPSFCHLTEKHFINDGQMVRNILYSSKYIFKEFNYNLDILNKLTKTDNRSLYSTRLKDTIEKGKTRFHIEGQWESYYSENKILHKVKNTLTSVFGLEIGTQIYEDGIKNSDVINESNDKENIYRFIKCIFIFGNQALVYSGPYGYEDDYRYDFCRIKMPNIEQLRIKNQKHKYYRSMHLCQHCGGEFKGIFSKVCSKLCIFRICSQKQINI